MDSEVTGVENLKETGRLELKERNALQREVLAQYGFFNNAEKAAWLQKNGQRISDIIDHDEMIKAEVRAAMKCEEDEECDKKLKYAASLIKEKLDELEKVGYEI